jgi:hypothetical protein
MRGEYKLLAPPMQKEKKEKKESARKPARQAAKTETSKSSICPSAA